MTVLFNDIQRLHTPIHTQFMHRIKGAHFDEVLYAHDTICISQNEAAIERKLRAIEKEGFKYGMKLNKTKCEILHFGNIRTIKNKILITQESHEP